MIFIFFMFLLYQCARVSLVTLTLARYILESSLVEYMYVMQRSSLMAAASLLLAMRMNADGDWVRCDMSLMVIITLFCRLLISHKLKKYELMDKPKCIPVLKIS